MTTLEAVNEARAAVQRALELHPEANALDETTIALLQAAVAIDAARRLLTPPPEQRRAA